MSVRAQKPAHRARGRRPFRPDVPLLLVRQHRELSRQRAVHRMLALIWLSVAVVVLLFYVAGGLSRFGTEPGSLGAVANLAALIGTDLVLVMILLAARIPAVDRVVGHDHALVVHRRLALPAFLLILAHIGLVIAALSLRDSRSFVAHSLSLMSARSFGLAIVSAILMLAVVVSSWIVVRRRLPFELWHAIHFLTYAFVILAIPHELGTANVFRPGTPEADYWLALHAVALGAALVFRFVLPLVRSARHRLRVSGIEVVSQDAFTVTLTGRRLHELAAQGGQYAVWRFWTLDTWWHAHPIGLSAAPSGDTLSITIRIAGRGTQQIRRIPIGTRVTFEGPYGRMTEASRTAPRLIAVAAGIGITPLKALIEQSHLAQDEAALLLRGTSTDAIYLWEDVVELARRKGVAVQLMLGGHARGRATWMSQEAFEQQLTILDLFPHLLEADVYVCGPPAWAELVARDALSAGLPPPQLHLSL